MNASNPPRSFGCGFAALSAQEIGLDILGLQERIIFQYFLC